MKARNEQDGFTLIELMVTIAIMVILMMIAAPSFVTFQRNSELTSTANAFLSSMATARAEAMKRGLKAYVAPRAADGSTSENWTDGWRVFVDTDWNGTYQANVDIEISTQDQVPQSITIATGETGIENFTRGGSKYVGFNGSGFPTLAGAATGAASGGVQFVVTGGEARRVLLNNVGRMRVCKPSESTCFPTTF